MNIDVHSALESEFTPDYLMIFWTSQWTLAKILELIRSKLQIPTQYREATKTNSARGPSFRRDIKLPNSVDHVPAKLLR